MRRRQERAKSARGWHGASAYRTVTRHLFETVLVLHHEEAIELSQQADLRRRVRHAVLDSIDAILWTLSAGVATLAAAPAKSIFESDRRLRALAISVSAAAIWTPPRRSLLGTGSWWAGCPTTKCSGRPRVGTLACSRGLASPTSYRRDELLLILRVGDFHGEVVDAVLRLGILLKLVLQGVNRRLAPVL